MIDEIKPGCDLEVDGGIDATTAPLVVEPEPTCWWPARQSLVRAKESRSDERLRAARMRASDEKFETNPNDKKAENSEEARFGFDFGFRI